MGGHATLICGTVRTCRHVDTNGINVALTFAPYLCPSAPRVTQVRAEAYDPDDTTEEAYAGAHREPRVREGVWALLHVGAEQHRRLSVLVEVRMADTQEELEEAMAAMG
eukprot:7373961-Prymnesium_polylepis.1